MRKLKVTIGIPTTSLNELALTHKRDEFQAMLDHELLSIEIADVFSLTTSASEYTKKEIAIINDIDKSTNIGQEIDLPEGQIEVNKDGKADSSMRMAGSGKEKTGVHTPGIQKGKA